MKKILFIFVFLLASCVETTKVMEDANKIQFKTSYIDDGNPIKIVPKVDITNSLVEYEKNLYIEEEAYKVCEAFKNNEFTEPRLLNRENLDDDYLKQGISKAIAKYNKDFEGFLLFVTGYMKVDYNNDGIEDILINHNVSYFDNKEEEIKGGIRLPYNYRYLTVYKNEELKEIAKGVKSDFYYQNPYQSSQSFIKIMDKNYLVTRNKKSKIVRIDLINKNNLPEIYCEFGV